MKEKIQSTLKSGDTEEWLDTVWTRPIGYWWARLFERLDIHPNTVTVMSMIIGAASAFFFASGSFRTAGLHGLMMNLVGVLLLAWANFYDSADGQLARMTGKKTLLGRILDGTAGDVWFLFLYHAVVYRFYVHHDLEFQWLGLENTPRNTYLATLVLYALGWFTGLVCHARQSGLADYYRQIHLFFLNGRAGSELANSLQQRQLYESTPWKGHIVEKLFYYSYTNYTRNQEKQTPAFQKLWRTLQEKYGTVDAIPLSFRDAFRSQSLPLMKWTNILTFNTRAIMLYVCCLADFPWFYLVFEIVVMSVLYFHMRHQHETFCKQFTQQLQA